jgi:hypothetical protein
MIRVGIFNARARRRMSVWVVALRRLSQSVTRVRVRVSLGMLIPEWIAHDEEGDIVFVRIPQDFVAVRFDHIPIGKDQTFAVECLLFRTIFNVEEIR